MGNGLCCIGSRGVPRNDPLIKKDVLRDVHTKAHNSRNEFAQIVVQSPESHTMEDVVEGQDIQHHRQKRVNQEPKHIDSLSEGGTVDTEDKNIFETGRQVVSDLDGSTDDTLSALEEPFVLNYSDGSKEEELGHRGKQDDGSYQHQRKSSAQISLQVQTLKVTEAGNPAVNGVYRWFVAHGRFVMFTDNGQYQIMGGVNLSEYGERYYDCWVIEEITENVCRLYAVASGESTSISCDGWFCVEGVSPPPKVMGGDERDLYDDDWYMDSEESETSISPMPTAYLPKEWVDSNTIDGIDGIDKIDWVD